MVPISPEPIHVLITAGNTSEKIDSVRKIVNQSSGRLGSLIAQDFVALGARVTYVCSTGALRPTIPVDSVHTANDVYTLKATLEELFNKRAYDIIVHAMAVSDYTVRQVSSITALSKKVAATLSKLEKLPEEAVLAEQIAKAMQEQGFSGTDKKISSAMQDLVLLMAPSPKVIASIKTQQPSAILVGFKLLVGVPETELIQTAHNLLHCNHCDYVLANDLENIHDDVHKALLIAQNGAITRLTTKQEIATAIAQTTLNQLKGK